VVLGITLGALPWRRVRALTATTMASAAAVLLAVVAYAPWTGPRPYLGTVKAVSHADPTGAGAALSLLAALVAGNLGYLAWSRLRDQASTARPVHR